MSIATVINTAFVLAGTWLGLAGLIGILRFGYWPLIFMALSGILVAGSALLDLLQVAGAHWLTQLALICMVVFNLRFATAWRQRGVTTRQLLFFRNQ